MKTLCSILRQEIVLTVAGGLAILSLFFVPPDQAYLDYFNLPVLSLLFCLMLVVAGFQKAGLFIWLSDRLTERIRGEKGLCAVLTAVCFFLSALVTNDVALLTFVPFTVVIMRKQKESNLIFTVVMETVAANLGSMLTPIGNPQNLYLYTYYELGTKAFFSITLPLWVASAALIGLLLVCFRGGKWDAQQGSHGIVLCRKNLLPDTILFLLCVAAVLKWVPYAVCFGVVFLFHIFFDRGLFARVDYGLLLTFLCFFVFVGNVGRMEVVKQGMTSLLTSRELWVSALLSQGISNVPAATMLAGFTNQAAQLLAGVNIGGLGTLIASMASLISYRQYGYRERAQRGLYLLIFSAVNVGLFLPLLLLARLLL